MALNHRRAAPGGGCSSPSISREKISRTSCWLRFRPTSWTVSTLRYQFHALTPPPPPLPMAFHVEGPTKDFSFSPSDPTGIACLDRVTEQRALTLRKLDRATNSNVPR